MKAKTHKLPTHLRVLVVSVVDDEPFLGPDGNPDFYLQKDFALFASERDTPHEAMRKLSKALSDAAKDLSNAFVSLGSTEARERRLAVNELSFCDGCGNDTDRDVFHIKGADLIDSVDFCSPYCLMKWVLENYAIQQVPPMKSERGGGQ